MTEKPQLLHPPPPDWPTHNGDRAFWEELGRTVATFGQLETFLPALITLLESNRKMANREDRRTIKEDIQYLTRVLSGTLGILTSEVEKELVKNSGMIPIRWGKIIDEIKALAKERNRLCHGGWGGFDTDGMAGTVSFLPRGKDLDALGGQTRSVEDLKNTRERVVQVIFFVADEIETAFKIRFSGDMIPTGDTA